MSVILVGDIWQSRKRGSFRVIDISADINDTIIILEPVFRNYKNARKAITSATADEILLETNLWRLVHRTQGKHE